MSKPTDLVQGTLDLLVLKVLALESMHGWATERPLSVSAQTGAERLDPFGVGRQ